MSKSRSGNRHMREDGEGCLRHIRQGSRSVLIRAEADYVAKPAGQHLLQMTVNLLARQYEVIEQIILDIPELNVLENTFPGRKAGTSLASELVEWGRAIAGPEILVKTCSEQAPTDSPCTIMVGTCDPKSSPGFCVGAVAEGWRFQCSSDRRTHSTPGTDPNPMGPYMAACFATGAIFNYFWQLDPQVDLCASLWGCTEAAWDSLPLGRTPTDIALPPSYLIGCGAVGGSLAFCLAAVPGIAGDLIPIDPQKSDETSRNRLLTMSYELLYKEKAMLVARLFAGKQLHVHPYVGQWPEYTADAQRNTADHIRAIEDTYRYEWVLSCVDRNLHRRAIARYLPRYVIGGSTQDFTAQVAIYSMQHNCECLACNHPVPSVTPTEELHKQLLEMNTQQRDVWFQQHDADARERAAIEEYLRDPECGTLGQATLAKLGREGTTDWSVGFVSVAAGILLASVYIQVLLERPETVVANGSEHFAWLLKSSLGRSYALRKTVCDVCGSAEKQNIYNQLWTEC